MRKTLLASIAVGSLALFGTAAEARNPSIQHQEMAIHHERLDAAKARDDAHHDRQMAAVERKDARRADKVAAMERHDAHDARVALHKERVDAKRAKDAANQHSGT